MEYLPSIAITLTISTIVAIAWTRRIRNMHKKYPNYKGDDSLNWGSDENKRAAAGRDGWDGIDKNDNMWHPDSNI